MRLDNELVLDLIIEAVSGTENEILAATMDSITQDARSNFVMKLSLGFVSSFLRMSAFGLPVPSHLI